MFRLGFFYLLKRNALVKQKLIQGRTDLCYTRGQSKLSSLNLGSGTMLLYFIAEWEPQVLFTVHSIPHMVTEYSFPMEFLLLYC